MFRSDLVTDGCYDKLPQNKNSYMHKSEKSSEVLVGVLPISMYTCVSGSESVLPDVNHPSTCSSGASFRKGAFLNTLDVTPSRYI